MPLNDLQKRELDRAEQEWLSEPDEFGKDESSYEIDDDLEFERIHEELKEEYF